MFRLIDLHRYYLSKGRLNKLVFIAFIVTFSLAMFETIWAVYLKSFIDSIVLIGFLSTFFSVIAIASYFFLIPFIEKYDKAKLYSLALLFYALCFFLFAINRNFYFFILIGGFFFISRAIHCNSFGIIVKDLSKRNELSKNEGFVYTCLNVAWVLGPLIAGYLADRYSLSLIFILSCIFIILGLLFFKTSKIEDVHIKKRIDKDMFKNIFDFFNNKNRTISYFVSGGISFWWVLIYLFMPLYILDSGLGKIWIGYFLFAVALPLVFFEYYFSKISLKQGFRKFFKLGYFIIFVFAFICFFVSNIYLIMGLIVLASVGVAMLEPTV